MPRSVTAGCVSRKSRVVAPVCVRGKPYFQINSAIAWTTLALTIHADGTSEHELAGASPFPRHWIYDKDAELVQKSGAIDFDKWYREAHEQNTPWGNEDSPAVVTAVERARARAFAGDHGWRGQSPSAIPFPRRHPHRTGRLE